MFAKRIKLCAAIQRKSPPSSHAQQVRCRRAHKDGEQEQEDLQERAPFLRAAKGPARVVQVVELDLHRRDGPLQVFVLVLFPATS